MNKEKAKMLKKLKKKEPKATPENYNDIKKLFEAEEEKKEPICKECKEPK